MINRIDPHRIANEIRMLRTRYQGAFLLVEGPTDKKVYFNLFNTISCKIIIAHGRNNALKVIEILETSMVSGILAILDSDFLLAEGKSQNQGNIILTDTNDLETMLLSSNAFLRVIRDLLPADHIDQASRLTEQCRDSILVIGKKIGLLRWVNKTESLNLYFKDLPYKRFINISNRTVDISELIRISKSGMSRQLGLTDNEIITKISELDEVDLDPWQICQGHDLISIIELVLPDHIFKVGSGNTSKSVFTKLRPEVIDHSLRIAFNTEDFSNTNVYNLVEEWEKTNSPYKLLIN